MIMSPAFFGIVLLYLSSKNVDSVVISGFDLKVGYENLMYVKEGSSETVEFQYTTGDNVAFTSSINSGLTFSGTVNSGSNDGSLTIASTALNSQFGTYLLTMNLTNADGTASKQMVLFYEEDIKGFEVISPGIYVTAGVEVSFDVVLTSGSNVAFEWFLDTSYSCLVEYTGQVRQVVHNHTFTVSGSHTIIVVAMNSVSSHFTTFDVIVLYPVQGFSVTGSENPHNTTSDFEVKLNLNDTASVGMGNITLSIDYGDEKSVSVDIMESTLSAVQTNGHTETHLYPKQGNYTIIGNLSNQISSQSFYLEVYAWDKITATLSANIVKAKVNEEITFNFLTPPNAGFQYQIFYGDGEGVSNTSSDILYTNFNVQPWTYNFTSPEVYRITFDGWNQYYRTTQEFSIIVQYPIEGTTLSPTANEIPLPDGVQTFWISMNVNEPSPTNVSCDFDSGFSKEYNVSTSIEYGQPVIKVYNYTANGTYAIVFDCKNEVSSVSLSSTLIIRTFTLDDFIIHYELVNAMNQTDSNTDPWGEPLPVDVPVVIPFRISLFSVTRLPPDITFTWDFGDGTSPESGLVVEFYKYHQYTNRGTYTIKLTMESPEDSRSTDLHIQLGAITFVSNKLTGEIGVESFMFTASGVVGGTYDFDLSEGNTQTVVGDPGSSSAQYMTWGRKFPFVTGSNGSFIEKVYIEQPVFADYVLTGIIIRYNDTLDYPPGDTTMVVGVSGNNITFPNVSCDIFFDDFVDPRVESAMPQNISFDMELVHNYQYRTIGHHTGVWVNCTNVISHFYNTGSITVNNPCFKITGAFDRQYSTQENAMKVYTSENVDLRNRMSVLCPEKGPMYNWTIESVKDGGLLASYEKTLPAIPSGALRFQIGEMLEGLYKISLNISLGGEFPTWLHEYTYLRFVRPHPHVFIVGGNRRLAKIGTVVVDAWTESYDAISGYGNRDTLRFTWFCYRLLSENIIDLENKLDQEIKNQNGTDAESFLKSGPTNMTSCTNLLTTVSDGIVNLNATSDVYKGYVLMTDVCMTSSNITVCNSFIQLIQTVDGNLPDIHIECVINCKEKYAITSMLSARAVCSDCSTEEANKLTYMWTIWEFNRTGGESFVDITDEQLTKTGVDKSSIVINENVFDEGKQYKIALSVTSQLRPDVGYSDFIFSTNYPPYGGGCSVEPVTGYPITTTFFIKCSDTEPVWKDEGRRLSRDALKDDNEPLTYEYLSYIKRNIGGTVSEDAVPLFKGSESTATEIILLMGDEAFDYDITVSVKIYDYFGDFALYNISTKVMPDNSTLPNNTDDTNAITQLMDTFNDTFNKINASGNILAAVQIIGSFGSLLTSNLMPQDTVSVHTSADIFKAIDGSRDPATMVFTVENSPLKSQITDVTQQLTSMLLTLIPDSSDNHTVLAPFDVLQVVQNLDRCIANTDYVSGQTVDNEVDSCVRLTDNLLSSLQTNKPFSVKKLQSIDKSAEGVLSALDHSIAAFVPETFFEPSDEITEESIEEEIEQYILYNNIDLSNLTEREKTERKDNIMNYLLEQKQREKQQQSVKIETAKRNVLKIAESIENIHEAMSSVMEYGEKEKVISQDGIEVSVEKITCEEFATKVVQRRIIDIQFQNDTSCHIAMELWLTYLKKPMRIHGTDAAGLTSPSITIQTRDMQKQSTKRPVVMRIGNEGTAYFQKYQPMYIEGDPEEMLYFIYPIKRKEATLFYLKPDALNFDDSDQLQEAFADKSSFDLYTTFARDKEIPRMTLHDFKHAMTVRDWSGQYGFKVFIDPIFEEGIVYIALKPIKGESESASKRKRRSVDEVFQEDGIEVNIIKRYRRNVGNATSSNVTTMPSTTGFNTASTLKPSDANFSVIIVTTSCRTWVEEQQAWTTEGCTVLELSTLNETVCRCTGQKGNVFATSFYVPPNTIDFSTVFSKFDPANAAVYGTLICLFVLYFILLLWLRRKDKQDIERWAPLFLADSDQSDKYFYLVTVHTGLRRGAGTKSNVNFVLAGEKADTGVRTLSDGINKGFGSGSVRKFFMGTTDALTDFTYLHIWHDNSGEGEDKSWYLHKILVDDLQENKRYVFLSDNWLAFESEDGLTDRIIPLTSREELLVFEKVFSGHARHNVTESHLWLSLLMRPEKSYFTRCQRVSCILALLMLTMIASAMFYRDSREDASVSQVQIGFLRFSLTTLYVSIISILITTPPILFITMLFKHARPRRTKDGKLKTKMIINVNSSQGENVADKKMKKNRLLEEELFLEKKLPLPNWVVYIAWVVTFLAVVVPAFFLILYSMEWGKPKSEEWLCTFFLSFIESLFLVDPVKVIAMAVLFAVLFRQPTDDDTEKVDLERLKVTSQVYNAGSKREKKKLDLNTPGKRSASKVMKKMKKQRLAELHAYRVFFEIALYVIYAFFLFSITYIIRDDRSYTLKKHLEQHLVEGTKTLFGFSNISSHEHFFTWMSTTLFPQFFPETDYNGDDLTVREKKYFVDLDNTRLGPARLRQVRMTKGSCTFPEYAGLSHKCVDPYAVFEEDTSPYCLNWVPYNKSACEYILDPGKYYTSAAWNYTSSEDIWGIEIRGEYNMYGGGGYILVFEESLGNSKLLLNELQTYKWIDRGTRAVFMEFTLYNSNVNLFTYVIFLFEFTELGGLITWTDIRAFRPYEPVGALGTYAIICYLVFIIVLIVTTVKTISNIVKQKLAFLKRFWNVLDIICVVQSYIGIAFWGLRFYYVKEAMSKYYNDKRTFINFQHVVVWDFMLNVIFGFLVFVATIRILRLLGYNKKVSQLADVVSHAMKSLSGFLIMFGIVLVAYGLLGYLLFGSSLSEYKSVSTTFGSLANTLIGKNSLNKMIGVAPAYAQLYFFTYAFAVIFVLMTMFVAILNFSITDVRNDESYNKKVYGIVDIITKSVTDVVSMIFKIERKEKNVKKRKVSRKKSEAYIVGRDRFESTSTNKTEGASSVSSTTSLGSTLVSKDKDPQTRRQLVRVYTLSDIDCLMGSFDQQISRALNINTDENTVSSVKTTDKASRKFYTTND